MLEARRKVLLKICRGWVAFTVEDRGAADDTIAYREGNFDILVAIRYVVAARGGVSTVLVA